VNADVSAPRAARGRLAMRWTAAALIAASIGAGALALTGRALGMATEALRIAEGSTLFLAAAAYLAYALAHHRNRRELLTRSILVSAFALWAVVALAPRFSGAALLNDLTMLLFVADLAILLSPWD
jgi:hypothetical protein